MSSNTITYDYLATTEYAGTNLKTAIEGLVQNVDGLVIDSVVTDTEYRYDAYLKFSSNPKYAIRIYINDNPSDGFYNVHLKVYYLNNSNSWVYIDDIFTSEYTNNYQWDYSLDTIDNGVRFIVTTMDGASIMRIRHTGSSGELAQQIGIFGVYTLADCFGGGNRDGLVYLAYDRKDVAYAGFPASDYPPQPILDYAWKGFDMNDAAPYTLSLNLTGGSAYPARSMYIAVPVLMVNTQADLYSLAGDTKTPLVYAIFNGSTRLKLDFGTKIVIDGYTFESMVGDFFARLN